MIAHLVRKYLPERRERVVTCSQCGEQMKTQAHGVVYCLVCGQPTRIVNP